MELDAEHYYQRNQKNKPENKLEKPTKEKDRKLWQTSRDPNVENYLTEPQKI